MVMLAVDRHISPMQSLAICTTLAPSFKGCENSLLADLEGLERRYRTLVDINKRFVEWRCRFGQLEKRVALYRAWDVLPESLQRSVANPPELLSTLKQIALEEQDVVLVDAWKALENYVNGSWRRLRQCVNATMEDVRRRELASEVELRIIEVQCSPPVMWIVPSRLITLPDTVIIDDQKAIYLDTFASNKIITTHALTWIN